MGYTLPETNSSPLKMDGWNTIRSFWGFRPIFVFFFGGYSQVDIPDSN